MGLVGEGPCTSEGKEFSNLLQADYSREPVMGPEGGQAPEDPANRIVAHGGPV